MVRFLFAAPLLLLFAAVGISTTAQAQTLCSSIMPSSAALDSKGTLGVGFKGDVPTNESFTHIRVITTDSTCYEKNAVDLMKGACISFLRSHGEDTNPPVHIFPDVTVSTCSDENKALDIMVVENEKLKRRVKALQRRLLRH